MKALKQFLQFDLDGFLADKEITFLDAKPYIYMKMEKQLMKL